MEHIGLRILSRPDAQPQADTIAGFLELGVAQVSDCMGRLYGTANLRPMQGEAVRRLAGVALTVKVRPGDNLLIHQALAMAGPGDVLVVDGGGACENALVGELMMLQAKRSGVAGFIIDGAVRDVEAFAAEAFPCYARGVAHRGPYKDGPGEINVPVSIDGLVVRPGDLVLADVDGVLAVEPQQAEALLAEGRAKAAAEQRAMVAIGEGRHAKPWLDGALARLRGEAK